MIQQHLRFSFFHAFHQRIQLTKVSKYATARALSESYPLLASTRYQASYTRVSFTCGARKKIYGIYYVKYKKHTYQVPGIKYNMVGILSKCIPYTKFSPGFFRTPSIEVGQWLGVGLGLGFGIGFTAFLSKTLLVTLEPHAGHTVFVFFPYCILYLVCSFTRLAQPAP